MDIRLAVPGIIGLVVFVIIFNVYHIIRIRKKRMPGTDAINAFKSDYWKTGKKKPEQTKSDDYVRFITKYNSSVDFVDKDDFIKEAVEQNKNQHPGRRYEKSLKGAGIESTIR